MIPPLQTLDITLLDGVCMIKLNRPASRNAIDPAMADGLREAFVEARSAAEVKVVLLTGEGGNFSSGGDVKQMGESADRSAELRYQGMLRYRRLASEIMAFDKPIVCAVDGVAYGAGFGLALLADVVLVSPAARMAMAFARIGLVPDLAVYYTLPRAVGLQKAKELIFSAREMDAREALDLGIAMEIVQADGLLKRATEIAKSFSLASTTALRLSKQALGLSLHSDFSTMQELEAMGQAIAGDSHYAREAVRRFRAKEAPQFSWPGRMG